MISKDEVKHIADLARLELSENETGKMQKDLSTILDYFILLKKAKKPEAMKITDSANILRKDKPRKEGSPLAKKLVEAAPDKKDGYIKVKQVL